MGTQTGETEPNFDADGKPQDANARHGEGQLVGVQVVSRTVASLPPERSAVHYGYESQMPMGYAVGAVASSKAIAKE